MAESVDVGGAPEAQLDDELERDLRRAVEAQAILRLLRHRAHLTRQTIATATGASLRSVRNWELSDVQLRQRNDDRLRYLAEVVAVLSGTLTPRGIRQWLYARNRTLGASRPVELLANDPDGRVLAAAGALAGDDLA